MSAVVTVSGLAKVYKMFPSPWAVVRELLLGTPAHRPFYALRDVSFEVSRGSAFGIIGENGAGKSTLLKILTGTTFASAGEARVEGRISSLLELGAGFHPELSGRQNIYFVGALMGLTRSEVRRREGEILAFSELEEFIDQPVKTYSSGMHVRLGFAVATGFDPEVLIIDEALAVGDQRFQKRCTDRILQFKRQGRTILFCSHNLYQVKTLCDRAVWLSRGQVESLGRVDEVVQRFNEGLQEEAQGSSLPLRKSSVCRLEQVRLTTPQGTQSEEFQTGDDLHLEVIAQFSSDFSGTPGIGISLLRNDGLVLYTTTSTMEDIPLSPLGDNRYRCALVYPRTPLLPGLYYFNVVATDQENLQAYDTSEKAAAFRIRPGPPEQGVVRLPHRWG